MPFPVPGSLPAALWDDGSVMELNERLSPPGRSPSAPSSGPRFPPEPAAPLSPPARAARGPSQLIPEGSAAPCPCDLRVWILPHRPGLPELGVPQAPHPWGGQPPTSPSLPPAESLAGWILVPKAIWPLSASWETFPDPAFLPATSKGFCNERQLPDYLIKFLGKSLSSRAPLVLCPSLEPHGERPGAF